MRKTHLKSTVTETFQDKTYNVKERSPEETARLEKLIEELDNKGTYHYQSGLPLLVEIKTATGSYFKRFKPRPVTRHVTAISTVEAAAAGRAAMRFI